MIGRRIEEDQIQTRSRELEKTKKTENYNTRERHTERDRQKERWWQVVGRRILGGEVSEHMERRGGTLGSERASERAPNGQQQRTAGEHNAR